MARLQVEGSLKHQRRVLRPHSGNRSRTITHRFPMARLDVLFERAIAVMLGPPLLSPPLLRPLLLSLLLCLQLLPEVPTAALALRLNSSRPQVLQTPPLPSAGTPRASQSPVD